jgi:hypothetical protein
VILATSDKIAQDSACEAIGCCEHMPVRRAAIIFQWERLFFHALYIRSRASVKSSENLRS